MGDLRDGGAAGAGEGVILALLMTLACTGSDKSEDTSTQIAINNSTKTNNTNDIGESTIALRFVFDEDYVAAMSEDAIDPF